MTETEVKQGTRIFHYQSCTREQKATGSCGCGDSWEDWLVLPGTMTDQEVSDYLVRADWEEEGSYRGPGRAFSRAVVVRRQGSRILVTQHGGLDI